MVNVGDCFYNPETQELCRAKRRSRIFSDRWHVDYLRWDCSGNVDGCVIAEADLLKPPFVRAKAIHIYTADGKNHGIGLTPEPEAQNGKD